MPSTIVQKLKIREADTLLTLHAPADFKTTLSPLPAAVKITDNATNYQQVHWFVTHTAQMKKELKKVLALLKEDVICWIYYPKSGAGIATDLTRDKGWEPLQAHNDSLTWISLISFNETWSAFGCRLKTVGDKAKKPVVVDKPVLEYIDAATKTVRLPTDLAAAIKKDPAAGLFFESLSYTNRKEYVEWIVSAKQPATRLTRVEGTMERLAKKWKNPRNT